MRLSKAWRSTTGQLLMVERDNMNAINVSSLAAGNYFARIMTANGTSTQRFTKE